MQKGNLDLDSQQYVQREGCNSMLSVWEEVKKIRKKLRELIENILIPQFDLKAWLQ